ncbi:triacylglycerol lipase OBL1-like isoform X1 [Hibiscus syriacus]|uniref:triacylglycerol lipase OBL1-like isoform X1 n=1 Tax=Hibiscus syriacus TaxID=106335 RepID=UPI001923DF8D|nr:triacylglycerol lipase OBL1-like isoform X1 [Hibiscus syriacus]
MVDSNINDGFRYLNVKPGTGGLWNLLKYSRWGSNHGAETDHRFVILVSIVVMELLRLFRKPMEFTGYVVEFFLNLISQNGSLCGLLSNILHGKAVIPKRGTDTFISSVGQLDSRVDLYKAKKLVDDLHKAGSSTAGIAKLESSVRETMDLCMMASKLAYENAQVVENVVVRHWKMHFIGFYNCWNDYQKEKSTQVFLTCDKPKDASLILISFRGTEPFDADNWSTDVDYSWYDCQNVGKIHMGFLEALGLGNREDISTFYYHLQTQVTYHTYSEAAEQSSSIGKTGIRLSEMADMSAYYLVREKLRSLLVEHENAKFVVTGHSLGGALAIMFPIVLAIHGEMVLLEKLLRVYTFGQPRVGDRKLKKFMEPHLDQPVPKYFRVVYCNDVVPRLPYDDKTFLYKHFGTCLYYNSFYIEQTVDEEPNKNYLEISELIPEYVNAFWELIRGLAGGYIYGPEYKEGWFSILFRVLGLALPGVAAHSPTDYINSVRLGLSTT